MSEKPTYEELEQQVTKLEKKVFERYRSEEEIERIFNLSLDMIGSGNLDGYFTKINSSFESILGYAEKEFLKKQFISFVHDEDVEKTKEALAQAVKGKKNIFIENRYRCRDDSYKWIDWKVFSMVQENKFIAVGRDITQRKEAEEALRESEEHYRNLYDNALVGMWRSRLSDGKLLKTNHVHAGMSGFSSPEEALNSGFKLSSLYPAERRRELIELLRKNGSITGFEAHLTYPDGREQDILISAKMFSKKNYMEGVVIDITWRKQAEQALHESEEKFRTLVEKSPLGISLIGKNGLYKHINPQFIRIFGYTIEDVPTGAAWFEKSFPDDEYRRKVIQTWLEDQKHMNVGQTKPRIFTVTCKDGSRKEIYFRLVTMENLDQLVIYEDITEKLKLEHQLQQAQRFEAIGTLAGGISHDFNNLLMGIQGRSSLMSTDLDPSHPHMEHLRAIEDYIRSAVNLTKQILGFARGGKYDVKPVNINELLLNSTTLFGRTRKEIKIHTKLQPSPLVVEADQRQIEQVLLNLYVNAWQAMPDGGELYLETKTVILDNDYCELYDVKSGSYAKISVTDTGIGMDESTRRRVFDPFFTTKEKSRGTGLGLASAFGIIKNHGGIITVHSEVGQGAAFNIYLPLSGKEVRCEPPMDERLIKGSESVLLVDDENMILEVGQAMLERLGYRVVTANGGEQAVEIIAGEQNNIDLVILDLIMPGMDGGQTFDRIRQIRADLPVILSSGYSINGKANDILQRGCNGFIQKPFSLFELSQKVQGILGQAQNPGYD